MSKEEDSTSISIIGGERNEKRDRFTNKLWVVIVLFIGLLLGFLSFAITLIMARPPAFPVFQETNPGELFLFGMHVVLSTAGMVLLVSLIVLYARTYAHTKANFMLGLLVVLFALLLQSILTYPLLLEIEAPGGLVIEAFSPIADVFTIVAFTVFLYLSLE